MKNNPINEEMIKNNLIFLVNKDHFERSVKLSIEFLEQLNANDIEFEQISNPVIIVLVDGKEEAKMVKTRALHDGYDIQFIKNMYSKIYFLSAFYGVDIDGNEFPKIRFAYDYIKGQ